jgi:hypothetical protein
MHSRMKFHLIAITAICLTVVVVFSMRKPPEEAVSQAHSLSSQFIIIHSATWGMNCNQMVAQTIEEHKLLAEKAAKQPPATAANAPAKQAVAPVKPTMAQENNALMALTNLCNNKEKCTFKPTGELFGTLGVRCYKDLEIAYRCFEVDRIRYASGEEDKDITIDCSPSADTPTQ